MKTKRLNAATLAPFLGAFGACSQCGKALTREEGRDQSHNCLQAANRVALEDERDRLRAQNAELVAALEDVELRCTQAKIASTIGKGKDRTDFLRGELERIAEQARAAIAKATGE